MLREANFPTACTNLSRVSESVSFSTNLLLRDMRGRREPRNGTNYGSQNEKIPPSTELPRDVDPHAHSRGQEVPAKGWMMKGAFAKSTQPALCLGLDPDSASFVKLCRGVFVVRRSLVEVSSTAMLAVCIVHLISPCRDPGCPGLSSINTTSAIHEAAQIVKMSSVINAYQ